MKLLQAGVDISVILFWLRHASIQITQVYLDAHIALTTSPLAKFQPLRPAEATRFEAET